jgi:Protein of unknown function (DUF3307)
MLYAKIVILVMIYMTASHTIADVFCQPRSLATTKHHNWWALTKHVLLYMFLCYLFTLPLAWLFGGHYGALAMYWLINGFGHFWIDAVTSRGSHGAWNTAESLRGVDEARASRYRFYSIAWICVDQISHMLLMGITPFLFVLLFA